MPFQKGNKYGGKRNPAGGRPSKKETEIKEALLQRYFEMVERRFNKVLATYFKEKGFARDVINRVVPQAKTEVEHSGAVGVYRIDAFDPARPDRKRGIDCHYWPGADNPTGALLQGTG
jgi:hypothetical protein